MKEFSLSSFISTAGLVLLISKWETLGKAFDTVCATLVEEVQSYPWWTVAFVIMFSFLFSQNKKKEI